MNERTELPSLHQEYAEWWESVAPEGVSAVQVEECRRAFYCGAAAMNIAISRIGQDDVSEAAGAAYLESLGAELGDYFRELTARSS